MRAFTQVEKECLTCCKSFKVCKYREFSAQFCSYACKSSSQIGKTFSEETKAKLSECRKGEKHWNFGRKYSQEFRDKLSKAHKGHFFEDIEHGWKGDDVGYRALHNWVCRHLGKPEQCENCGITNLRGHKIHWANKSHTYLRDISDWIRLCVKCHKKYDSTIPLSKQGK